MNRAGAARPTSPTSPGGGDEWEILAPLLRRCGSERSFAAPAGDHSRPSAPLFSLSLSLRASVVSLSSGALGWDIPRSHGVAEEMRVEEVREVDRAGAARPTSLTSLCGGDEGEYSRSSPQKMREREVVCRPGRRSLATLCSSVLSFSVPPCLRVESPLPHRSRSPPHRCPDRCRDRCRQSSGQSSRQSLDAASPPQGRDIPRRHGVAEEMRVEEVREVNRAGAARPTSLTSLGGEEEGEYVSTPLLKTCGSERSFAAPAGDHSRPSAPLFSLSLSLRVSVVSLPCHTAVALLPIVVVDRCRQSSGQSSRQSLDAASPPQGRDIPRRHGVTEEMRVEEVREVNRAGAARPTSLTSLCGGDEGEYVSTPLLRRCGSERSFAAPAGDHSRPSAPLFSLSLSLRVSVVSLPCHTAVASPPHRCRDRCRQSSGQSSRQSLDAASPPQGRDIPRRHGVTEEMRVEEVHEVNRAGAARPTSLTSLGGGEEGEYSCSSPQKMREREVVCRPGRRSLATLCSSVLSLSLCPPCLRGESLFGGRWGCGIYHGDTELRRR